jgi:hypothetical protein
VAHFSDLWNDGLFGPFRTKYLGQLLQVLGRRLSDAKHGVAQPGHAERSEFLIEELYAQLAREERNILDNSETNAPLFVLG